MRLIDADALDIVYKDGNDALVRNLDDAPTIDAVPIGYIMQRADALIETNVYGAKVLYGLVMIWRGKEQNDE